MPSDRSPLGSLSKMMSAYLKSRMNELLLTFLGDKQSHLRIKWDSLLIELV